MPGLLVFWGLVLMNYASDASAICLAKPAPTVHAIINWLRLEVVCAFDDGD